MFFREEGIVIFWSRELANFCELDSGIDNTGIREMVVRNRASNVEGIRESGELLGTLESLMHFIKHHHITRFKLFNHGTNISKNIP